MQTCPWLRTTQEFTALLPPGRVSRSVLMATFALTAIMAAARPAAAQAELYPRRDTVLLARDLDGDGHVDYVVLEVRGTTQGAFENRIAVYLDQSPEARRPKWASRWEYEGVGDSHLDYAVSLATDVGLLDIAFYGGDGDDHTILLVHGGRAHVDIAHRIDYGQGYLTLRRERGDVVIDASIANLELRRVEVPASTPCGPAQWAMMRLRYDRAHRRFMSGPRFCVKAH